jgi:hypothetical protein
MFSYKERLRQQTAHQQVGSIQRAAVLMDKEYLISAYLFPL